MVKAIVLFSGGLDSAVALATALRDTEITEVLPLCVMYGQKHMIEASHAKLIVKHYQEAGFSLKDIVYPMIHIDVNTALTKPGQALPKGRSLEEIENEIGVTYVPARNAIFLSIAAAYAESGGYGEVWTGFNANDARGFPVPDGRVEFVAAMELALMLGTKCGVEGSPVRIKCPLIHMNKAETVEEAARLDVPWHLTYSCFVGGEEPCGECDACTIRKAAFRKAGSPRPPTFTRKTRLRLPSR